MAVEHYLTNSNLHAAQATFQKKNYFSYLGDFYRQIRGIAKGPDSLQATQICLGGTGRIILYIGNNQYRAKFTLYPRYIEYILIIWNGSDEDLGGFLASHMSGMQIT